MEFSARSWAQVGEGTIRVLLGNTPESDCSSAQVHSIDVERLQSACRESEMRDGLLSEPSTLHGEDDLCLPVTEIIASFLDQPNRDFLVP